MVFWALDRAKLLRDQFNQNLFVVSWLSRSHLMYLPFLWAYGHASPWYNVLLSGYIYAVAIKNWFHPFTAVDSVEDVIVVFTQKFRAIVQRHCIDVVI